MMRVLLICVLMVRMLLVCVLMVRVLLLTSVLPPSFLTMRMMPRLAPIVVIPTLLRIRIPAVSIATNTTHTTIYNGIGKAQKLPWQTSPTQGRGCKRRQKLRLVLSHLFVPPRMQSDDHDDEADDGVEHAYRDLEDQGCFVDGRDGPVEAVALLRVHGFLKRCITPREAGMAEGIGHEILEYACRNSSKCGLLIEIICAEAGLERGSDDSGFSGITKSRVELGNISIDKGEGDVVNSHIAVKGKGKMVRSSVVNAAVCNVAGIIAFESAKRVAVEVNDGRECKWIQSRLEGNRLLSPVDNVVKTGVPPPNCLNTLLRRLVQVSLKERGAAIIE